MLNKITVFGKEIRDKVCSTLPVRVKVKRFDSCVLCEVGDFFNTEMQETKEGGKTKKCTIGLTEKEIVDFYNEAESVEVKEVDDEKLLIITTKDFQLYVVVGTKGV